MEKASLKENCSHDKPRVLVVDDEYLIGKSIAEILDYLGYKADFVQTPAKAREFLERNPDLDIVLLDINLGIELSGIDLLPIIKEKNKYVQVIMFTSEDKLEVGVECMRLGAYDYMTKPFDEKTFLSKAPGALERKKILQLNDLYLGILFHDLKNPLQGIMAGVELLRMSLSQTTLTDLQKNAFHQAERSVSQILMMINNIVAVSKFESGALSARRELFILQKEVESSCALFNTIMTLAGHPSLAIHYFTEDEIIIVTDKDLFSRVLVNIVSNALRYASEKSIVRVDFSEESSGDIHVSITNTGSFIEDSARSAIFNKFSSVQVPAGHAGFQNYGLGLTFSKMAVEAMEGRIWITCDKALPSTTFHFTVKNFND
jgi:two-component system, sensor histidine kinase and response regulator